MASLMPRIRGEWAAIFEATRNGETIRKNVFAAVKSIPTDQKKSYPTTFGGLINALRSHAKNSGRDAGRINPEVISLEFVKGLYLAKL